MDLKKYIEKVQKELFMQNLSYSGTVLLIWKIYYFFLLAKISER